MTTSGTKTFTLEIDEIIDAAYLRVGGDHITGRDAQTSRRALNVLLIDLINRGVPLAALEEFSTTVTSSVASYTLDSAIMDIVGPAVLARSSVETHIKRIPLSDYKQLPRKDQTGRPTQFTTHRDTDAVTLTLWPMPENSTDIVKYWAVTKIQDVTRQQQTIDLPTRYIPAIVSGLAYYIGLEKLKDNIQTIQFLKAEYEDTLQRALDEDRERSTLRIVPSINRIFH